MGLGKKGIRWLLLPGSDKACSRAGEAGGSACGIRDSPSHRPKAASPAAERGLRRRCHSVPTIQGILPATWGQGASTVGARPTAVWPRHCSLGLGGKRPPERIKRNYCSLLEWQDSYSASRWGQVGAPNSLEEGCGEAAQAFCQGAPYSPPVGSLLLSAGATHWAWASSGHSLPVPLPCLLPAAVPGLPLRLPPGWTHLVAANQDLRAPDQGTPRGGAEAHSAAYAPRRP